MTKCNLSYNLRHARAYDPNIPRTVRFSSTYLHNAVYEWNLVDNEIKSSASNGEFERKLLAIIRPPRTPIFNVHDIICIKQLTKLRFKFSDLNEHKFRHNFDCLSPICDCEKASEDNEFSCTALFMTLYGKIFLVILKTFLSSTFRTWTPNHSVIYPFSENLT